MNEQSGIQKMSADQIHGRAEIRADFIKRLFAVAISVGFASSLINMEWVINGSMPTAQEWGQLMILATGLVATVLSWDGYLVSISEKPLTDYWRFSIDIILVFIYMFFLISSKQPNFWLPILVVVFSLYVAWDMFTIWKYHNNYLVRGEGSVTSVEGPARFTDILKIYWGGFQNKLGIKRGPIITLSWAIYFVGLMLIYRYPAKLQVVVMCMFAITGLLLYRHDKVVKSQGATVAGFRMKTRALLIVALLSLAVFYVYIFRLAV